MTEDEDDLVVPRRIGFCSNLTSSVDVCGVSIFDDDIEAVELPKTGRRRTFCCSKCVDALLATKPQIDLQEKIVQKRTHRNGLNGNGGKPKAQPGRHYW